MKKSFWLKAILYAGYLSLAGWLILGLPVLLFLIAVMFPYPKSEGFLSGADSMSEFIIDAIYFTSIYLLAVASSIRGIMSIRKILRGGVFNKFDILYIVLLVIAGILFCAWMAGPYG